MNPNWTAVWQTWGSIGAAVGAAAAAGISYFLFRSQTDPEVVVYVLVDPDRQGILNLVIENIGRGVAKNVTFAFSKPIPLHAFNGRPAVPMDRGPLVTGIRALGPGAKRVITWGHYAGLRAVLGGASVDITARYESDTRIPWAEHNLVTVSIVEIASFDATDISDTNYPKQATRHLETIAKSIDHLASGFRRIRVEVISPDTEGNESDITELDDDLTET